MVNVSEKAIDQAPSCCGLDGAGRRMVDHFDGEWLRLSLSVSGITIGYVCGLVCPTGYDLDQK